MSEKKETAAEYLLRRATELAGGGAGVRLALYLKTRAMHSQDPLSGEQQVFLEVYGMPDAQRDLRELLGHLAGWADGWKTGDGSCRTEYVKALEILGIDYERHAGESDEDIEKRIRRELLRAQGTSEEEIDDELEAEEE